MVVTQSLHLVWDWVVRVLSDVIHDSRLRVVAFIPLRVLLVLGLVEHQGGVALHLGKQGREGGRWMCVNGTVKQ